MGYTAESDLPEKEKIKLAFARRDAMLQQQHLGMGSEPPPPDYGGSPPREPLAAFGSSPPPPSASFVPLSAAEEKARLKAQYEAEEAAGRAGAGGSGMRSPPPEPPSYVGETRPLTAIEEKALLQARMAAEQPVGVSPPAPPPRLKSPPLHLEALEYHILLIKALARVPQTSHPATLLSQRASKGRHRTRICPRSVAWDEHRV
jgi:hypothetical protein